MTRVPFSVTFEAGDTVQNPAGSDVVGAPEAVFKSQLRLDSKS